MAHIGSFKVHESMTLGPINPWKSQASKCEELLGPPVGIASIYIYIHSYRWL